MYTVDTSKTVIFIIKKLQYNQLLEDYYENNRKKDKKGLASFKKFDRIATTLREQADLAQLVEQLTCNQ